MISLSQQYKDAVYSPSRAMGAKVIFQITDVTAQGDASITVTAEASISKKAQLANDQNELSGKFATFENNYWKLDGSFVLPPKASESGPEVGWWSNDICGSDGIFPVPQVITVQFTQNHSSIGLTIFFDTLTDECASDFTIQVYDSLNALINTTTVTGNALAQYTLQQNLSNYRKIVITITKWKTGYRRARVTEVVFGIVEEYIGSKLISAKVLEEIDTNSNQVSSNELMFALDNQDKRFNIMNPTGIYPYLQRKQKLIAHMGIKEPIVEYAPMGIYYLSEWKSDEGALTASFTARDILDILAQSTYRKGLYQTRSLYNLAIDVLTDAGITNYLVDAALQAISVTGYIPICKHREALQMIAIAGMAVVYSDRYGKVIIKQLTSVALTETIGFDNVYNPPQIKLDKLVNKVDVNVNTYTPQASSSQVHKSIITINGTQDVWIEYSDLAQTVSATVTGGTLNTATYFGNAALLNITAAGSITITATGTVLDKSAAVYELKDVSAPSGEQVLPLKVENTLISGNDIASNVATWILAEVKKRFLYEINWRMNPALEAGDIVTVQDNFSSNKTMRIIRQEFVYQGYMSGKTNGRG
ncbi:MAG: hypothetical protein ACYDGZ_27250 [Desulfosporosinus fructosivorans]